MKLTTPLKAFFSLALLAGAANAASLSLGALGLTESHPGPANANTTLLYTDPSGITIQYSKANQSDYSLGGAPPVNSRGWSHDSNTDVVGFQEIAGVAPDHLAIAHFNGADQVNISFANATDVDLSTVKLTVWDLDTNNTGGNDFTELLNVRIDGTVTQTLFGAGVALAGDPITEAIGGISQNSNVQLLANSNPFGAAGLSAFTLTWDPVPEPSTGLLALIGGSLLFLRRRR